MIRLCCTESPMRDSKRPTAHRVHRERWIVMMWPTTDFMLWPGFVFPPDFCHGLVNALGEHTGDRKSSPSKVSCPCSGPNKSGDSLKPRPKTQWYVKVGHFLNGRVIHTFIAIPVCALCGTSRKKRVALNGASRYLCSLFSHNVGLYS